MRSSCRRARASVSTVSHRARGSGLGARGTGLGHGQRKTRTRALHARLVQAPQGRPGRRLSASGQSRMLSSPSAASHHLKCSMARWIGPRAGLRALAGANFGRPGSSVAPLAPLARPLRGPEPRGAQIGHPRPAAATLTYCAAFASCSCPSLERRISCATTERHLMSRIVPSNHEVRVERQRKLIIGPQRCVAALSGRERERERELPLLMLDIAPHQHHARVA